DIPSGTAVALQRVGGQARGVEVEIASQRGGGGVGFHQLELGSNGGPIVLSHDVVLRRTFAGGGVVGGGRVGGSSRGSGIQGYFQSALICTRLRPTISHEVFGQYDTAWLRHRTGHSVSAGWQH